MKKLGILLSVLVVAVSSGEGNDIQTLTTELSEQLQILADNIHGEDIPRSWNSVDGYCMVEKKDWTSGFPAGTFWYLYELTGDEAWKETALRNTLKLDGIQFLTDTHDLGFMIFCSYGNAFRLTGDEKFKKIILQASDSLMLRFDPIVGCIKSWDWSTRWQFPVIIDNMINLEMLFWASQVTGDSKYRDVAMAHADTTLAHHFREDMSSYHVINYDPESGEVLEKATFQGYSDDSSWARGQAWGLYGYSMCYRETGDEKYLKASEEIANYIIKHLPDDWVSYWDFNDPKIPDTHRDAAAAAVIASALYELAMHADESDYRDIADKIFGITFLTIIQSDAWRQRWVCFNAQCGKSSRQQ